MVSVLASSAVDRGFKSRWGQTKDYKIGICCFSTKHAALRSKSKDWLARNQEDYKVLCPSVVTCLSANCCVIELACIKIQLRILDLIIISLKVTCSGHDIAEKLLSWH